MNKERLFSNPLSKYLLKSGVSVSDWGIEESNHSLITSSLNDTDSIDASSTLLTTHEYHDMSYLHDWGLSSPPKDAIIPPAKWPKLHKFIREYYSLDFINGFWEQFKYNLIISNLLDDTLYLSKNDPSQHHLIRNVQSAPSTKKSPYNILTIKNSYHLEFEEVINNKNILLIHFLMIYLLRRIRATNQQPSPTTYKLTRILVLLSFQIIRHKRIYLKIQSNRAIKHLKEFLAENYKLNKNLIGMSNKLREIELFKSMSASSSNMGSPTSIFTSHTSKSIDLFEFLDDTLSLLILKFRNLVFKLIFCMNGMVLEKYVHLNGIDLPFIGLLPSENNANKTPRLNEISVKMNKFNMLRKFFIIELLTINEKFEMNFLLNQIWNHLGIKAESIESNLSRDDKLLVITSVLEEYSHTISHFNGLFTSLDTDMSHEAAGTGSTSGSVALGSRRNTDMDILVNKLSEVKLTLQSFDSYTPKDAKQEEEKRMLIENIGSELSNIQDLYQMALANYKSVSSPASTSQLKVFKTRSASSRIKKRFSLPPTAITDRSPSSHDDKTDKKYKRLSTGLNLSLLTVLEEPKVAYDDNYINIAPDLDDFHSSSIRQISVTQQHQPETPLKKEEKRFSLYSMSSNISDLNNDVYNFLSNDDEDYEDNEKMSKLELTRKLETNLGRVYNARSATNNNSNNVNDVNDDSELQASNKPNDSSSDLSEETKQKIDEVSVEDESENKLLFLDELKNILSKGE